MIDIARNAARSVDPGGMIPGPKVLLLNEFSASDGDIVAYRFKTYKLGPVVGKRSWGGVGGNQRFTAVARWRVAEPAGVSRYDVAGKEWIMEGHGVDPDVVVDNDPAREFAGEDEQLNRAIELVKEEAPEEPVNLPPPPPYPDKSK